VRVCLDCGWSEFAIPQSWLSAGWLQSLRPPTTPGASAIEAAIIAATTN